MVFDVSAKHPFYHSKYVCFFCDDNLMGYGLQIFQNKNCTLWQCFLQSSENKNKKALPYHCDDNAILTADILRQKLHPMVKFSAKFWKNNNSSTLPLLSEFWASFVIASASSNIINLKPLLQYNNSVSQSKI